MRNSIAMFIFLFSTGNTLFEQIWSKKLKLSVMPKFDSQANSNIKNSMTIFTFSVLNRKEFFCNSGRIN